MNLFTRNLERLFSIHRKSDGSSYTEVEIEAASIKAGFSITKAYILRLRSGESSNPSYDKIAALANFFGVHAGYFFDEHEDVNLSEISVKEANISKHQSIAMRAIDAKTDQDIKRLLVDMAQAIDAIHSDHQSPKEGSSDDNDGKKDKQ